MSSSVPSPLPTVALVGAGPGLGRSLARRFGSTGRPVALVARNADRLERLVAELAADGITARAFPADVCDRAALTGALETAAAELGEIGVLGYSPAPTFTHEPGTYPDLEAMGFTTAASTTVESVQPFLDLMLLGALAASAVVLPAMRAAGDGALLFTTGSSAVLPVPRMANAGIALAGLRAWALRLHNDLAGEGVYVGHLPIGLPVVRGGGEGDPDVLADLWLRLVQERSTFEVTVGF